MPLLNRTKADPPPASPTSQSTNPAVPAAAQGAPVKSRRRPSLIALGLALIIVCSLGAYWLVDRMSTTSQVVVAAADVPEGQVLTADDLSTTNVNVPAGTAVIPASQLDTLVGQRAVAPLDAGALIAPGNVSAAAFPASGTAVVGVRVATGQIPINDVNPGDQIQIIGTPREGDDPPTGEAPSINGTVQAISQPGTNGTIVVDVLVAQELAPTLTSLAATGRIGIILTPEAEDETAAEDEAAAVDEGGEE